MHTHVVVVIALILSAVHVAREGFICKVGRLLLRKQQGA